MVVSERLFAAGLEQLSGTVVQIRADAKGRLDLLEQRLADAERAGRFNTDALDHALTNIEIGANQRALDQVESQRRAARTEHRCDGMEDSLARVEMRLPDENLGCRLAAIEQALAESAERLKPSDVAAQLGASMQALSHRLESVEQNHRDILEVLRDRWFPAVEAAPRLAEAPPLVEPPDFADLPEAHADGADYSTPPDFADIFAAPEPENFLSQARRSARIVSEKSRPRYLFPALVAALAVLALAAGLSLSGRMKEQAAVLQVGGPEMRAFSPPEPPDSSASESGPNDTEFVVAPQGRAQSRDGQDSAPVPHAATSPERVAQMANAGDPIALTILGLRALDGAVANLPDAVRFLTAAAEKGQPVAQYRLGTLYERGQGVAVDTSKAAHWYEMAANQGNRKAMHNLAVFNARGAAGQKNTAEAARWFAKAAALGLSDSQFNLAVLYERGDGLPQSLLDAFKWYAIAAAAGDGESRTRLAALQTQLGDADKAVASRSAASFHAAPLNRSANVPPQLSSLGS